MCLWVDGEGVTLDSGRRRARKQHQCDECFRAIDPGEPYQYWTVAYEGSVDTQRMCQHCWNTIELGSSFTGCPKRWYWEQVHDLNDYDGGSFVYDILHQHELTIAQKRAIVRCVRGYRRKWRDSDGNLLPLVELRGNAA